MVPRVRAAVVVIAIGVVGALVVSGSEHGGPRTPGAAPGMPKPFLATALVGDGRLVAGIDAYGSLVEARRGSAGPALTPLSYDRQKAGSVDPDTGIVVWAAGRSREPRPPWEGRHFVQRYRRDTNVLVTGWTVAGARVSVTDAAAPDGTGLARRIRARWVAGGRPARVDVHVEVKPPLQCRIRTPAPGRTDVSCGLGARFPKPAETIEAATAADRAWLERRVKLGPRAPAWAREMYERSVLAIHALMDPRSGALPAGTRDFWAYVWPRDAAIGAIALRASGHRDDARRVVRFLDELELRDGARFDGRRRPVEGRPAAGDAAGWIDAAGGHASRSQTWRGRDDYWENGPGDYLGNALATGEGPEVIRHEFGSGGRLHRTRDPRSGLDSAAAWAVVPFHRAGLNGLARRTLLELANGSGRYGIKPGTAWSGPEPWMAPTATVAWALADLGEGRAADRLLGALRRAATPAGALPERVDPRTGLPVSTTPLLWPHAATVLALLARFAPSLPREMPISPE